MDDLDDLLTPTQPTAQRPMLGMTILVVEDSRLACETLRLMCLRSGARIRRADSLAAARRHLRLYRPSAVIVDIGLPDGPGLHLIGELNRARPRVGVLLGLSGDTTPRQEAKQAGADGFLVKPLESLVMFQKTVLSAMPAQMGASWIQAADHAPVKPDLSAYYDDMSRAASLLEARQDPATIDYATQFLGSVAHAASDRGLERAAEDLARCRPGDGRRGEQVARLMRMLRSRIEGRAVI